MAERAIEHGSFTIERIYDAPPARVFDAWARRERRLRWFPVNEAGWEFDFRAGGREFHSGRPPGETSGPVTTFDARYVDIVPNERIVFAYTLRRDGVCLSASVVSVELAPVAGGTRLRYHEQGIFLDGNDRVEEREAGTRALLDALARNLPRA